MLGWVKYLVYILSFFFPPMGIITFWVSLGRGDELEDVARWSFLAAFIGIVVCVIVISIIGGTHRMYWPGRW